MVMNVENAFKFVLRDKNWIIKLLVGGVLSIIPVVNFIVFGYVLNVLKDAKEGKAATMPDWREWSKLFKDGVSVFVIGLLYGLIVLVLWLFMTLLSVIPVIGCLSFLIFPLFIVAIILYAPIVNIGLCRYLDKGQIQDAMNLKEVYEEFKSKLNDYLVVTLINAGVAFIASLAFCVAPFIYFWLWLVIARMLGEIFGTQPTKIGS
jgi:hypothetical protein